MMRSQQCQLPFHGGPRPGSGRPRGNRTSHAARPRFGKPTPVHVTLRVRDHVFNLRSGRAFRRIRACFAKSCGRFGARLVEFSVQGNHLHLIVEADSSASLSRALQGLSIRIAKALNSMMKRAGAVFADHYHSRLLQTPTELVRAIRYLLGNAAHHFGAVGTDGFSSAALPEGAPELAVPVGWLLRRGTRRADPRLVLRW